MFLPRNPLLSPIRTGRKAARAERSPYLFLLLILAVVIFAGCQTAEKETKATKFDPYSIVRVPTPRVEYSGAQGTARPTFQTKAIPGAQLNIGFGSAPNDASGDTLRTFAGKTQTNFTELYSNVASLSNAVAVIGTADRLMTNNGTAFNPSFRGSVTNSAVIENGVQTLTLSGTNYTASWTNNPNRFRINLSADSGLTMGNATGTNRDVTFFVYGDATHYLALPNDWVLRGGAADQPFTNGVTVLWVERLDGTNYLDTSIPLAAAGGSGDVTAAFAFGVDNRIIVSDGTGKGVKASGVSIDTSGNYTASGNISISGNVSVANSVYGAGWNGSQQAPTKDAVYDKIESLATGVAGTMVNTSPTSAGDEIYAADGSKTNWTARRPRVIDVTKPPYNAVADNATDCTSAINAAFAAAGNPATNAVYIPAGSYKVRPLNNPPPGLVIYGDGKALTKLNLIGPTAGDVMLNITNSGVTVRGLWFNGTNANCNVSTAPVSITGIVHRATGPGGVYDCKFEGWNVGLLAFGDSSTSSRMNVASYKDNYATNNWTGIMCGSTLGGNDAEYITIAANKIHFNYHGIYNLGAGNVIVEMNNINDCTYPYRHGGSSAVAKGNSLVVGNLFNHGQLNIGAPGGGSGTLRFTGNMMQGSQVAFGFTDAASTVITSVTMDNNDFSDYIFFNSSTTISNCFIENNTFGGTGNVPNRYNWTGPSQCRFFNNRDAITGFPVFEGHQTPYVRAVTATATVTRFDDTLKCTGTFTVNLPSATTTALQKADGSGVVQPWGFHILSVSGTQTVTPAAGNINGGATLSVVGPKMVYICTDGANWYAQ